MLSRREQQELDRIESWFETADPELAEALREHTPSRVPGGLSTPLLSGGYLLGMILTVAGFASMTFPLIFFGIVLAVVVGTMHIGRRRDAPG